MDPITAIALAKSVASATGLDDWFKNKLGDVVGDKAANKVLDIAQSVTGASNGKEALQSIMDDESAREAVKLKILDQEQELLLAHLQDVQNARSMYTNTTHQMADQIAGRVITWNHWLVLLLIAANGVALGFVQDKVVALTLGNLIGTSIGALWQERQQVIGFFFGSSLGSKIKDLKKKAEA